MNYINNNDEIEMSKITINVENDCVDWIVKAYPNILSKISDLESWKDRKPSLTKVRELTKEIKRPIAFLLSKPKIKAESIGGIDKLDARTINSENIEIDYKTVVLLEVLNKRRSDYLKVAIPAEIDVMPKFPTFKESDKARVIEYIRNFIYPNYQKLQSIKDIKGLYELIVSKIEDLNILVFRNSQTDKKLRGLAIYYDILPIISIPSSDFVVGQIFTLIHELAHILLKNSMVHNKSFLSYSHSSIEKICNEIAGNVLLPNEYILNDDLITSIINKKEDLTLEIINDIANKYKISRDVVLIRLLNRNFINQAQYDVLYNDLENDRKKPKQSIKGKDIHLYKTINELGMKYCKAIFRGWQQGVINKSDLNYYIGRKDKYCLDIMQKVSKRIKK